MILFLLAGAAHTWDGEFGRFGLAVKTGEAAGPMGIQLAWNPSPRFQLCAGGGGVADLLVYVNRSRTDSYFVMAKAYRKHLYIQTGYSLKVTKTEYLDESGGEPRILRDSRAEHGIPMHVGYEFGHRRGFYFSTSAGYIFVPGGGGKTVGPEVEGEPGASSRSARSGPSLGMSVGYYLW
jgi:hypothetical protein